MKSLNYILFIILFNLFVTLTFIPFLNYKVDPLQVFKKSTIATESIYSRRYSNYQIIKHGDYDLLFMGTSMLNTLSEKLTSEILEKKVRKINMAGSSIHEQYHLVKMALKRNPSLSIFWEINFDTHLYSHNYLPPEQVFPLWLFQGAPVHKYYFNYLTTLETLKNSIKVLRNKVRPLSHSKAEYNKVLTLSQIHAFLENEKKPLSKISSYKNLIPSAENNILKLAKEFPDAKIIGYFSPQSIYYLSRYQLKWKEATKVLIGFKEHFYKKSLQLKNLSLYDFQNDEKLITNLNNFYDIVHHNEKISHFIPKSIKESNYLIQKDNYKKNLKTFENLLKKYSPEKIFSSKKERAED